jgi:ssDNA-binding Zn-finger/Zn-ribbon topoisomerase 1
MVLRTAKSGQNIGNKFWGCSCYPQCKSTINISNDKERITEQIRKMEEALRFIGL